MAEAANSSNFNNVVIMEQVKTLREIKEMIKNQNKDKQAKADSTPQATKLEDKKALGDLNENLQNLNKAIISNIKTLQKQGEAGLNSMQPKAIPKGIAEQSGLRKLLLGTQSQDEIKKGSWFQKVEDTTGVKVGKYSPSQALGNMLSRREQRQADEKAATEDARKKREERAKEKADFITAEVANSKRGIALKNLKGEEYSKDDAAKRFEQIKEKEEELLKVQQKIFEQMKAGYDPKKKDQKEKLKIEGELNELDPRRKAQANKAPVIIQQNSPTTSAIGIAANDPGHPESAQQSLFKAEHLHNADPKQNKTEVFLESIANTLKESLDVQRETLKKMAGGGGEGGDNGGGTGKGMFSGMSGIAKNLLAFSAALFITAKALQEFASVTWGGLFKGVLAMTGLVIATNKLKDSDASKTLLALGASLYIVSKALENFNNVNWGSMIKGAIALGGLVLLAKAVKDNDAWKTLLALGASLYLVAKGLNAFNDVEWGSLVKGGIALLGLVGITKMLSSSTSDMFKAALGLGALGAAIYVIGKALDSFAEVEWGSILKAGVVIGGLALMGEMLGAAAIPMALGAVGLGLLGGAIWVIGKALEMFQDLDWETIGKAFVAITGLGVLGAIAGVAAPLILLGAAAIGAMGLALLPFAAAMAIAGPAMDQFADGMERLSKISGSGILELAGALGALSVAMVAFAAGNAIAGLGNLVSNFLSIGGDSPVEQLLKISKAGPGVAQAADGLNQIGKAMEVFAKVPKDAMEAVNDFPWVRATAFVAAGGKMSVTTPEKTSVGVMNASKSNEDMKAENASGGNGGGNTNIVSAPQTSVVNNNTIASQRSPIRNRDSTMNSYISSRYAT